MTIEKVREEIAGIIDALKRILIDMRNISISRKQLIESLENIPIGGEVLIDCFPDYACPSNCHGCKDLVGMPHNWNCLGEGKQHRPRKLRDLIKEEGK